VARRRHTNRHHFGVPIYEFDCLSCGAVFEELTKAEATPECPSCGGIDVDRRISLVAPTPRIGLRGGDARRSEARRRDSRERAAERRRAGP
jgi:putative FmdB family regulatory protein